MSVKNGVSRKMTPKIKKKDYLRELVTNLQIKNALTWNQPENDPKNHEEKLFKLTSTKFTN